jgi:hypothetical protein
VAVIEQGGNNVKVLEADYAYGGRMREGKRERERERERERIRTHHNYLDKAHEIEDRDDDKGSQEAPWVIIHRLDNGPRRSESSPGRE